MIPLTVTKPVPACATPKELIVALGRSSAVMVLKVGAVSALPLAGPAKKREATCVFNEGTIDALKSSGYDVV
jgi:hypothetical protein